VLVLGVPWPAALGLVFWSGAAFLLLTLTGVRQLLLNAFPHNLKVALTVGIGLFISFIGIKNAGLVTTAPAPMLLTLGDLTSPAALLTLGGLVATIALMSLRVPGAIFLMILAITFVGLWLPAPGGEAPLTRAPESLIASPAGLDQLWLALDFGYLWHHLPQTFPALLTLVFLDLFSSLVAMNAMCQRAGLTDASGNMRSPKKGLSADALATMGAALLGTSTTNVYAESAAGIETGGRTGLTAIVVGLLFLLALFLSPLLLVIPPQATAPALMLIGVLMFSEVRKIDFDDLISSGAAVLTLFLMPVTSITDGLAIGLMVYVSASVVIGRGKEISLLSYILAASFAAYYVFTA
jgi:AGZA family xanthine/uracil permease-like MFS transporter